jgi:hypothetical protein
MVRLACVIALGLLTQTSAPALRIVVLEGEDAVNVVQQKTAVRPLVEVRDRNNLPVAGATVTFTVGSGQPAAFGAASSVTVTTNAAGQAAATGFAPTGIGQVTVQVQAAYQGQVATAAITQTNLATAAGGAAAGGATSGGATTGGAATGGAAGAGGGLSATTIVIAGAAVAAGGAVAATQTGLIGGDKTYTGSFTAQYVWANTCPNGGLSPNGTPTPGIPNTCSNNRTVTGELEIELNGDGTSGRASVTLSHRDVSASGFRCTFQDANYKTYVSETPVSGGPSALAFSFNENFAQGATGVYQTNFSGSLSGETITATLSWATQSTANECTAVGSFTAPVTLTR